MFCPRKASELFRKHYEAPYAELCAVLDCFRGKQRQVLEEPDRMVLVINSAPDPWHLEHEASWVYSCKIHSARELARRIWLA